MKKTTLLLAIFLASFTQLKAQVVVVNPVSATTTFTGVAGTELVNTYNGVGLTAFPSATADHAATDNADNCFVTSTITGTIDFDLGGTQNINGLSFWNQNAGGPSTDTGINTVNFYYSTDNVTYTLIPGAPSAFTEVLTGVSAPETFTFDDVSAAYIRMEVLTNHGDATESGFAEIAFSYDFTLNVDSNKANSFSMYPNPASNNVVISATTQKAKLEVYSITGKLVVTKTLDFGRNTLNVSNLASGIYLAKFSSDSKTEAKKLIVK